MGRFETGLGGSGLGGWFGFWLAAAYLDGHVNSCWAEVSWEHVMVMIMAVFDGGCMQSRWAEWCH